ncbi:MAG: LamG domain-containing protein, partial [Candidatus Thermoplasmatota archaeon]|nr:LamG domain-containing protein [Candidatus Thermoplasmatota archaeon]
ENPGGVWNSNYVMVQHLNETSGMHYDSTSYDNDGVQQGGVVQDASGVIDGCDDFDGSNDYVSVADDDILSFGDGVSDSPFTVSAWIYPESYTTYTAIIGKDTNLPNREWALLITATKLRLFVKDNGGGNQQSYDSTNAIPLNDWTYVVASYDGRGGNTAYQGIKLYIDGVAETLTNPYSETYTAMANTVSPVTIGEYYSTSNCFDGLIDEVRVSNVVRSSGWIKTKYNNHLNPSTFYNYGNEEISPQISWNVLLNVGWNMMSIPLNESIAKENLTVNVDGVNYSWQDAVDNGSVLDFVYGWNASTQVYLAVDVLEPGEGYWMYAYESCILKRQGV